MDLNTVTAVERPVDSAGLQALIAGRCDGDAWLGGGTWLFSEPQPGLRRLVDLSALAWQPLHADGDGLAIAATCTIAELAAFRSPPAWRAAPLIGECCRAFLASFKIWNMATVGGNLCAALPAGPMISLCAALEGVCTVWTAGGERQVPMLDFVLGPQRTVLAPNEVLRRIDLPFEALSRRTAFRQVSLTALGRSAALLIGTAAAAGTFSLSVTAATRRPVSIAFDGIPDQAGLRRAIDAAIPAGLYYDDVHGSPEWRRHMTLEFAEEIRRELAGGASP